MGNLRQKYTSEEWFNFSLRKKPKTITVQIDESEAAELIGEMKNIEISDRTPRMKAFNKLIHGFNDSNKLSQ